MKLFLDENITPKASQIFMDLGYEVESIQSYKMQGISDEEVFDIVINESRILITQNGKDFIVQMPPKLAGVKHAGLIWIRSHVTRANVVNVCSKIDSFLKGESPIADSIWKVKQEGSTFHFDKRFPPPTKVVSF